jgi:hypothetical protein
MDDARIDELRQEYEHLSRDVFRGLAIASKDVELSGEPPTMDAMTRRTSSSSICGRKKSENSSKEMRSKGRPHTPLNDHVRGRRISCSGGLLAGQQLTNRGAPFGGPMDWWVIEYDNKNFDSHVFIPNLRDEFVALMTAAGGGPFGTTVCTGSATLPDNKLRFYFNAKAASIPGVNALLSKYQARPRPKPTERPLYVLAGNHPEPL